MSSDIWGSPAWFFLHTITLNYPSYPTSIEKYNIIKFFNSLGNILPCSVCKEHYIIFLQKYPIEKFSNSKEQIFKWLVDLHNGVNKLLNKNTLSYNDVIIKYNKIYDLNHSLCKNNYVYYINYIIVITIIIILVLLLYNINIFKRVLTL